MAAEAAEVTATMAVAAAEAAEVTTTMAVRLRRLRPPLERLRRNRDRLRRLRWLRRWWLLVLGERRTNLVLVLGPVTSCLLRMLSQGSAPGSAYRKNAADYRDRSQGRLPHASLGAGVNRKFFPVSPDHSPGLFPGVPEFFFPQVAALRGRICPHARFAQRGLFPEDHVQGGSS